MVDDFVCIGIDDADQVADDLIRFVIPDGV